MACTTQTSNPDISGIGTRTSFYLQCFLSVILANRSWEDAPSVLWTLIATNFGLTVAAIAQAEQGSLTFYEAVEVSNLVWLANFSTLLSMASYSRQKKHRIKKEKPHHKLKHDELVKYSAVAQTIFSMPLTIYLWATASSFGSSPDCNPLVKYVFFFGIELDALTKGRIVGLVVTSLLAAIYVPMTVLELRNSFFLEKRKGKSLKSSHNQARSRAGVENTADQENRTVIGNINTTKAPVGGGDYEDQPFSFSKRRPRRVRLSKLDSTLIGIFIFQSIIFTYFIICNELYVTRNHTDNSDAAWGFGQILSLVITLPSVISFVRAFRKHGFSKLGQLEDVETSSSQLPIFHPYSHNTGNTTIIPDINVPRLSRREEDRDVSLSGSNLRLPPSSAQIRERQSAGLLTNQLN